MSCSNEQRERQREREREREREGERADNMKEYELQ